MLKSFNPAEAEEGFKRIFNGMGKGSGTKVSIQPKPKKGLKAVLRFRSIALNISFNPAEAEEGFKSYTNPSDLFGYVTCFNPAEAEEGFKSLELVTKL